MWHVPSVSNDTSPQEIIPHKDLISRLLKSNGTQSQRRQLRHREWFHWYQPDIRPAESITHIYTGLVFGKLPVYGEVNGSVDCNWYQYQQKSSEMWTSSRKKLCTLMPMLPIRYFVFCPHGPKCAKTPPNRTGPGQIWYQDTFRERLRKVWVRHHSPRRHSLITPGSVVAHWVGAVGRGRWWSIQDTDL